MSMSIFKTIGYRNNESDTIAPPYELDKEAQIPSLRERYYTTEDMRKSYDAFRMRGFPHNTDSYGNETFEQFLESLK